MSRIVLVPPDHPNRPPNTGDQKEFGDSFYTVVTALNSMTTDLYGQSGTPSDYFYLITSFAGVDPTGNTDSTTGIQNAINTVPDGSCILFPQGSTFLITSTINVVSRTHLKFIGIPLGDAVVPGAAAGDSPKLLWNGAANGTMFYFQSCFNPSIWGFNFNSNVAINRYIRSDLTGLSGVTGTALNVNCCSFVNPTANLFFIAVSVSETSTTNQENAIVDRCNFQGNGAASLASSVGVLVNTSNVVTCSNAPFSSGQIGKRIRVSYIGGILDTTITAVGNGDTTATMAASYSGGGQSNCTVHVGMSYGIGIFVGNSQNSKHHKFRENVTINNQYDICAEGGSFSVVHLNGEASDFGICFGYSIAYDGSTNPFQSPVSQTGHMTEPCLIDFFESEADVVGIYGAGGNNVTISNSRLENDHQAGNGFLQLANACTLINNGGVAATPGTNQQLVQVIAGYGGYAKITSVGNDFGITAELAGFNNINGYPHGATCWTSLNDTFDTTQTVPLILGSPKAFGQMPDDPQVTSLAVITDSTSNTWGATIAGSGSYQVLAWYNGTNWTVVGV